MNAPTGVAGPQVSVGASSAVPQASTTLASTVQQVSTVAASALPLTQLPPLKIDWRSYEVSVIKLALQILQSGWDFDYIVGIGRGGIPVADVLSRIFHKTMGVIMAQSYKCEGADKGEGEKSRGKLIIAADISIAVEGTLAGKKVVLVDDLVESGVTLKKIKKHIEGKYQLAVKTAVIHKKTSTQFDPDFYVDIVEQGRWIFYPYERLDKVKLPSISELKGLSETELDALANKLSAEATP